MPFVWLFKSAFYCVKFNFLLNLFGKLCCHSMMSQCSTVVPPTSFYIVIAGARSRVKEIQIYLRKAEWWIRNSNRQTIKQLSLSQVVSYLGLVILLLSKPCWYSAVFVYCWLQWPSSHTLTVWSVTIISVLIFPSTQPATLDTGRIHTDAAYICTHCSHLGTHIQTYTLQRFYSPSL